jgi:phage shock protein E
MLSTIRGKTRLIPWAAFFCLALLIIILVMPRTCLAAEGKRPLWWDQAHAEALANGYGLLDADEMDELLAAKEKMLLLDVRPDYEFQADHLPGALNLEFHLGDRSRLRPGKKAALRSLLGPDLDRKVVIYCRSYQ